MWKGDFWREFGAWIVAMTTLWGLMVALYERFRTHRWRWKGKTPVYAMLGGILVFTVTTLAYFIYQDILHIEYDQDVNYIIFGLRISKTVQPFILHRQVWTGRIYHHIAVKGEDSIFLIMASNMWIEIDRDINNHIRGKIYSNPIYSLRQPFTPVSFPKVFPDSISSQPSQKFGNNIEGFMEKNNVSFEEYRQMEIRQIDFRYEGKVNGKWMKGHFKGIGESGEFEAKLCYGESFHILIPPPPVILIPPDPTNSPQRGIFFPRDFSKCRD